MKRFSVRERTCRQELGLDEIPEKDLSEYHRLWLKDCLENTNIIYKSNADNEIEEILNNFPSLPIPQNEKLREFYKIDQEYGAFLSYLDFRVLSYLTSEGYSNSEILSFLEDSNNYILQRIFNDKLEASGHSDAILNAIRNFVNSQSANADLKSVLSTKLGKELYQKFGLEVEKEESALLSLVLMKAKTPQQVMSVLREKSHYRKPEERYLANQLLKIFETPKGKKALKYLIS